MLSHGLIAGMKAQLLFGRDVLDEIAPAFSSKKSELLHG
jgi:hypothetical protein